MTQQNDSESKQSKQMTTIDFLRKHHLRASDVDIDKLVQSFTVEMINGLEGKESSLRMIPTYIEADNEFLTEVPVLAIDAGGTNFRTSLIQFNRQGKLELGEISGSRMPGLEGEISGKQFFREMAQIVKPLADKTDRIGFCFSYPTEILPNRDGRLIQFCKEVQAPEVVGQLIGENLLKTLETPQKQVVLLNDTVATLLAGKSASFDKTYDSFIGYILGTGTNTCYIEQNSNILKNNSIRKDRNQIINIESGNFGKANRSDLDLLFDQTTGNPGCYTFEKMFSGGYFGGLCLFVLKTASAEGVFSKQAAERLNKVDELTAEEANHFVSNSGLTNNILHQCFTTDEDIENCNLIIDSLIERASKLVAANLASVIIKTGKGRTADCPILITIEGTTFYKMHQLKERFENYLFEYLKDEKKRYTEFKEIAYSSLIGAALAALID
jgi:hexokinase